MSLSYPSRFVELQSATSHYDNKYPPDYEEATSTAALSDTSSIRPLNTGIPGSASTVPPGSAWPGSPSPFADPVVANHRLRCARFLRVMGRWSGTNQRVHCPRLDYTTPIYGPRHAPLPPHLTCIGRPRRDEPPAVLNTVTQTPTPANSPSADLSPPLARSPPKETAQHLQSPTITPLPNIHNHTAAQRRYLRYLCTIRGSPRRRDMGR
ncbi:hypothetical protein FA13DRAFT_888607 [Coprinellus micaceus]|uniref:Uncharacterized protein n=1 Tax=Coprinellus micaceus TaxID=71717 RepID=A0A4Y7TSX9_COPMI|nr:hypothetical protein FA13DRAFT_888607 [Coprinellus micaceus]